MHTQEGTVKNDPGQLWEAFLDRGKGTRIAAALRARITDGFYTHKLPTQRELAEQFGAGKGVVDRALRKLESEGLVWSRQGSGYYVRRRVLYERHLVGDVLDEHALAVAGEVDERGLFERMTGAGDDGDVDVATVYAHVPAPARVAALLKLPAGTRVLERTWSYTLLLPGTVDGQPADEVPYQIARSYMPLDVAAAAGLTGPESERKGIGTLWQLIQRGGYRPVLVHRRLESRMPTPAESAQLAILPGTPVFDLWGALYRDDGGAPMEAGLRVVPADRAAFVFDIDLRKGTAR